MVAHFRVSFNVANSLFVPAEPESTAFMYMTYVLVAITHPTVDDNIVVV